MEKLGIGTTSPTAFLHLKAGGTAVNSAPLKLIAGNSLSATEIGAVEYDGTSIFFTDSGTIRQTLTFNAGTQTLTSKTLNNPTIGTPVITAGTATSTVLNTNTVGTPTITGGTWTSGTINAGVLGTPTISDFTNATHAHTSLATGGTVSHTSLSNIGSNTHATIDTHISSTGTAVHGLGNMAVQNSNALSVTGGTVTTTTIGTNTIVGGTATSTVLNTNTIGDPDYYRGFFFIGNNK